jgi:hypothetical protein
MLQIILVSALMGCALSVLGERSRDVGRTAHGVDYRDVRFAGPAAAPETAPE